MAIHHAVVDKHPRCRHAPSHQGKRGSKKSAEDEEERAKDTPTPPHPPPLPPLKERLCTALCGSTASRL
eukprot:76775-Pleurochrysis_carterae.AAC.1